MSGDVGTGLLLWFILSDGSVGFGRGGFHSGDCCCDGGVRGERADVLGAGGDGGGLLLLVMMTGGKGDVHGADGFGMLNGEKSLVCLGDGVFGEC